jgi:hypothetical protein
MASGGIFQLSAKLYSFSFSIFEEIGVAGWAPK